MTEKDFKRLSREDLLELLVGQNREAERLEQEILILTDQLKRLKTDFDKTETLYNALARYSIVLPNRNVDAVRQELTGVIRKCQSGEIRAEFEREVANISNAELFTGNKELEETENGSVLAESIMDMAAGLAGKIGDVSRGNAESRDVKAGISDSEEDEDAVGTSDIPSKKDSAEKIAEEPEISDEFEEDDMEPENVAAGNSYDSHDDSFWMNFQVKPDNIDGLEQHDSADKKETGSGERYSAAGTKKSNAGAARDVTDMASDFEDLYDSADEVRSDSEETELGFDSEDISEGNEYRKRPKKSGAKMSRMEEALAWAKMQFGGKK